MQWTSGGGDTYTHYLFARYAFEHPHYFVDHWGKPIFTLFAAPFAQLGLKGVELLNILCGLGAGVFASLTAKQLGYKFHFLAVVFTVFAPVMYIGIYSGLTEPISALVLIAGVYFYSVKKYKLGSVILSFLILCRTELFIYYPLFLLFLWWVKSLKAAPFLLTGFMLYGLIGWPYYGDFFWIITKQPYGDASAVYGSGSFWHFAESYDQIIHQLLSILLLVSIIRLIVEFVHPKIKITFNLKLEALVLTLILSFFFAHSTVWWLGKGASAGLVRVMMVIVPLIALIALKALEWKWLTKFKLAMVIISAGCIYTMKEVAEHLYEFPKNESLEVLAIRKLDKDKINDLRKEGRLFYYHSFLAVYLDADPSNRTDEIFFFTKYFELKDLQPGDVYIWDKHFGKSEGGTSLEAINKAGLELIDEGSETWDGHTAEVKVFVKR